MFSVYGIHGVFFKLIEFILSIEICIYTGCSHKD